MQVLLKCRIGLDRIRRGGISLRLGPLAVFDVVYLLRRMALPFSRGGKRDSRQVQSTSHPGPPDCHSLPLVPLRYPPLRCLPCSHINRLISKRKTKKEEGSRPPLFSLFFFFLLFVQIFQCHPHRLDHKRRKGAICSNNLFFNLINQIVGETNGFTGAGRDGRYFEFTQSISPL